MKRKFLFILGTRPEIIKTAPVIKEIENKNLHIASCLSGQHIELVENLVDFFSIKVDFRINLKKKKNRSLNTLLGDILLNLDKIIKDFKPTDIVVQGDTTTALAGAITGFHNNVRISHIEAGLRSFNKNSPFPEEINRSLIDRLADINFAPTEKAKNNLISEGIRDNVYVVGNTVVDALFLTLKILRDKGLDTTIKEKFKFINFSKKIITITLHRRENFGEPLLRIINGILRISKIFEKDVEMIFPVHPNPNVRKPVFKLLRNRPNIYLIEPLTYYEFVWLMTKSHIIITDSGGIQEEAPYIGVPLVITRDTTEREEVVSSGAGCLVGSDPDKIFKETEKLLKIDKYSLYNTIVNKQIYGDGTASKKIAAILCRD